MDDNEFHDARARRVSVPNVPTGRIQERGASPSLTLPSLGRAAKARLLWTCAPDASRQKTDKHNKMTTDIPKAAVQTIHYTYDPVTVTAAQCLCVTSPGTISEQSHLLGMERGEPLIVAMDALIKQAKAHRTRFFSKLSEDYVLGPCWLEAAKGIRGLCNGDGAVALHMGRSTDSKDNGTVESMFWSAMEIAGFTEADLAA